jgi:hypothetical protein
MTIREFIQRRVRFVWILFIGLLLTALIAATAFSVVFINLNSKLTVSVIVSLGVAMVFWLLYRIKCPRCQLSLGLTGAMGTADNCPNCDVSFAEPAEARADATPALVPPLTIRKYLYRRYAKFQTILLVCGAIGIIFFATQHHLRPSIIMIFGGLVAVTTILTSMVVMALTPCPRCYTRLGMAGARAFRKNPTNNCCTCGVHFDDRML